MSDDDTLQATKSLPQFRFFTPLIGLPDYMLRTVVLSMENKVEP